MLIHLRAACILAFTFTALQLSPLALAMNEDMPTLLRATGLENEAQEYKEHSQVQNAGQLKPRQGNVNVVTSVYMIPTPTPPPPFPSKKVCVKWGDQPETCQWQPDVSTAPKGVAPVIGLIVTCAAALGIGMVMV
ncbi:hypothetical protein BJ508DRAFT_315571 [Ascobolus immersus RN42]|uniref:Uncharacterized protein n=1 Tax=Ascobolus immersus RN42 TaxID=1160509 RepID=A0A3N4HCQ9_ASCIM|nr:hypothetical protein BJ508DRAFT_315571 [Ascobolus immersus RN42]